MWNKEEILISVIMSTYNETVEQINKSTLSILNQDFHNIEFIIVLDNPENKDLRKFLINLSEKDNRVKVIYNKENIWLWFSLNRAINFSTGDYIARMDGDDISNKERLSKQLKFLLENQDIDILFTWYNKKFSNWENKIYLPPKNQNIKKMLFDGFSFLHASIMTKRQNYLNYNYNLTQNPEEFELFFRMIKGGLKFYTLNEDLYTYFIYKKSDWYRFKYVSSGTKDFFYLLLKNINIFYSYNHYWMVLIKSSIWFILSRNKKIFNIIVYIKDKIKKTY